MNLKNRTDTYIIALIFTAIALIFVPVWLAFGILFTFITTYNLIFFSSKNFDVRHLILFIATIQWVSAAILSYYFVPQKNIYSMKVPPEIYFSIAIPGILFYALGLFFPLKYPKIDKQKLILKKNLIFKYNSNLDIFFLFSGIIFFLLDAIVSEKLRFITFLLGGFFFIGLAMILTNPYRKNKKIVIFIAIIFLLMQGIIKGGFGLIFNWLLIIYIIYDFLENIKLKNKIIFFVSLFIIAVIMQSVKFDYRKIVWFNDEYTAAEQLKIFSDILKEKDITDENTQKSIISRINQGWIISEIIKHLEYNPQAYLNGESINKAIWSVILPRSIYKNRSKAGGREYFTILTGRQLTATTSMNLSTLGEAYGNYGQQGSFIFMFIFGLFINITFLAITNIVKKNTIIIYFIPMLYQQTIKAENDFFISLNHIVKSSIFIFASYMAIKTFFKLNLHKTNQQSISNTN